MHSAWSAHPFMLRQQHLSTLDMDTMDTMDIMITTDMAMNAGTGNKHESGAKRVNRRPEPLYLLTRRSID
jgi:hypothetical protein